MSAGIIDLFDRVTVMESFAVALEKGTLDFCNLYMEENRAELQLTLPEFINRGELLEYCKAVESVYGLKELKINLRYPGLAPDNQYFQGIIDAFLYKNPACRICLSSAKADYSHKKLKIHSIRGGEELLNQRRFVNFICDIVKEETGLSVLPDLDFNSVDIEEYIRVQDEEKTELAEKVAHSRPVTTPVSEENTSPLLYGKAIGATDSINIADLSEGMSNCVITGEVLTADSREIKGKRGYDNTIIEFNMGDDTWGCFCKIFAPSDRAGRAKDLIKTGKRLRVKGNFEIDDFSHKPLLKVASVEALSPIPIREDTCDEKRVELHLHTKMSMLDAVASAGDLIKRAAKWGHKAVAITDHGVAQAFPEAHKAASDIRKGGNQDFKVIYGVEGYLINDGDSAVHSLAVMGKKQTYVVFDIETTGLSPMTEEITEIGAVKIENGEITGRFS